MAISPNNLYLFYFLAYMFYRYAYRYIIYHRSLLSSVSILLRFLAEIILGSIGFFCGAFGAFGWEKMYIVNYVRKK